jgi:ubiquinone/menaquinone biosynthesis C-methylase UbiE
MSRYQWDNAWQQARQRLAVLEARFDPGTFRLLEALGVRPGDRCLEVGGGGGTIAAWLCERVGSDGCVVATDLDTRFLRALECSNLQVLEHNIVTDDLPVDGFDLVHCRALLQHLPGRETALDRMTGALKPGGWLLAEEPDLVSLVADPSMDHATVGLFTKAMEALQASFRAGGSDPFYGRRLYRAMETRGLVEQGAEGRLSVTRGGSADAQFLRLSSVQVRDRLLDNGLTPSEFEAYLALLDDPAVVWMEWTMLAVWGQRPVS